MVCILIIPLKELGRRRETRIPGFMKNYVYSEYWKSILRILLIKNNNKVKEYDGVKEMEHMIEFLDKLN